MRTIRPPLILAIEDNPADVRLIQEALRDAPVQVLLQVARNGEEALDFLRGASGPTEAPRPDFILLDLNLPRKDGRELLAEIKQDPALRSIPVIVLTSSAAPQDIARSHELQANSYVIKPVTLRGFGAVIHQIVSYWLCCATLPG